MDFAESFERHVSHNYRCSRLIMYLLGLGVIWCVCQHSSGTKDSIIIYFYGTQATTKLFEQWATARKEKMGVK